MSIDLEDKEIKPMFTYVNNNEGKPTGQQTIVIPTFDLYSKEVDDGTGNKRNHYICIQIITSPTYFTILKITYYVKYHLNLLMILILFLADQIPLQKKKLCVKL